MERECGWAVLQTAGQQERAGDVWIASYCAAYVYTHALTLRNKNIKHGLVHSSYIVKFHHNLYQCNTLSENNVKF